MTDLIVSVSGVRGVVGRGLTADVVRRFTFAFGRNLPPGPAVLGRDSRPHGTDFARAAAEGLSAAGHVVRDAGIVPTPTCGYLVADSRSVGGVQVTASHNPAEWNGLKLFGADGAVLPADRGEVIRSAYEHTPQIEVCSIQHGEPIESDRHVDAVLKLIQPDDLRSLNIRVAVDGNGGAGGPLALALLGQLGCDIRAVACETDGAFRHPPEPTPEHLAGVARDWDGRIGFCLDPDADRLALIDETGRCLSEELTLALAVWHRLAQSPGPVVVNQSTSRVVEDVAARFGVPCHRTAVGEANVVAGLRNHAAVIGGEGNGGVIDPQIGWVRDPFVGMVRTLDLMRSTGQTLAELADSLPRYVIRKDKYPIDRDRLAAALDRLSRHWPGAAIDRADGLRLSWPDRWLHVRASNTEPIARAIAEAPDAAGAADLCRAAGELLGATA